MSETRPAPGVPLAPDQPVEGSLQRSSRQAEALLFLAKSPVVHAADFTAALQEIARTAAHTLGVARVGIWRFEEGESAIRNLVLYEGTDRSSASGGLLRAADVPGYFKSIGETDVLAVEDAPADPRTRELASGYLVPHGIGAMMDVPILVDGARWGILCHEHVGARRAWMRDEQSFGLSVANIVAVIVAQGERRKSDEALEGSEARFRAMVESAADAIVIAEPGGRIVYFNAAAERMFRMPREEAIGSPLTMLMPERYRAGHLEALQRLRERGDGSLVRRRIEVEGRRKDGSEFPLELVLSGWVSEGSFRVSGILRDLSERKSNERYRTFFLQRRDGVWRLELRKPMPLSLPVNDQVRWIHENIVIAECNPALAQRMGAAKPEDMVGRLVGDYFDLRAPEFVASRRKWIAAGYRFDEEELEVVTRAGARGWLRFSSVGVIENEHLVRIWETAIDITEQKHAQRALQHLIKGTATVGKAFFERLVQGLGEALNVKYAFIAEVIPGAKARTLSVWANGGLAPNFEYGLAKTPCENVVGGKVCFHRAGVAKEFPADPLLTQMGVDSYLGSPLVGLDGKTIGLLVVLHDGPIDESNRPEELVRLFGARAEAELTRLRADRSVADSEARFRQMAENIREVFWLMDLSGPKVIYISPAYESLWGRSAEALYADPSSWLEAIHPEDRDRAERSFGEQAPSGRYEESFRIVRPDGTVRWIHARGFGIKDESGKFFRMAGISEDVTEMKSVEEALRESEQRLSEALRRSQDRVVQLEEQVRGRLKLERLVGKGAAIQEIYRRIRMAAQSDVTVLITGESGTGKELAASAIHSLGGRKAKPFVAVNCSAIPEHLLESELFGHAKGAFTGATREKEGLLEAAKGGTLFLDEIGDLSTALQVKLLRVLQEREFRRVGDTQPIKADVRLVAATHRDLKSRIASGDFREDFYYRINVFTLHMPPLRERRDDVPILVAHFLQELSAGRASTLRGLTSEAMRAMMDYPWPGNVRELRNALEHAAVLVGDRDHIRDTDLPPEVLTPRPLPGAPRAAGLTGTPEDDRRIIQEALKGSGGKKLAAAQALGISRVTLWKRMRELGL